MAKDDKKTKVVHKKKAAPKEKKATKPAKVSKPAKKTVKPAKKAAKPVKSQLSREIDLPMSQAAKLFREGAGASLAKCKVSKRAVEAAAIHVQRWLERSAENAAVAAGYLRTKTIKPKTLLISFPQEKLACAPWIKQAIEFAAAGKDKKTKYEKGLPHFSEATVVRIFNKALGYEYRMSEDAKRAVTCLAEAKMRHIGRKSAVFTKNAKRTIVSLGDVESAFEIKM